MSDSEEDVVDDMQAMHDRFTRANTPIGTVCAEMCRPSVHSNLRQPQTTFDSTFGAALWIVRLGLSSVMRDTYLCVVFGCCKQSIAAMMPYVTGVDPNDGEPPRDGECHGGPAAPQGTRCPNPVATVPGRAAAPAGPPVPVRVAPWPPSRC